MLSQQSKGGLWNARAGLLVKSRCRCDKWLPPCADTIQAELCCHRAVHTRYISHAFTTPHHPHQCFILGHQKIEAIFQLFKNISAFIERIPVQCHTQLTRLCCSPHILPLSTTGDLQGDPSALSHHSVPVWQGRWSEEDDGVVYGSPLLRACFLDPMRSFPFQPR